MCLRIHIQKGVGVNTESISEPIPHKHKAGIILVGDVVGADGIPRLHVVAPWTQGSFSTDGKKAYMLAKGTIDPDEKRWDAAIREMGEETGVYIDKIPRDARPRGERRYLFDPENKRHQRWKAEGRNCFYEGVEIERIEKKPIVDCFIPSNRGNPTHHTIYMVKVKGIENLEPYLKHHENNIEGDSVKRKAFDISISRISQAKLPGFFDMLQTLRSGWWSWGEKGHGKLFDSSVAVFEKDYLRRKHGKVEMVDGQEHITIDPAVDAEIMSGKLKIGSVEEFDDFYQNYAITHDVQDTIKERVNKIRKYMEKLELTNDASSLKVDTKNTPLRYYQEGGDIIPYDVWLDRAIAFAEKPENRVYREAQFNTLINDRRPEQHYEGTGQSIGGLMLVAGRKLDLAEASKTPNRPGTGEKGGSVVFNGAEPIFNELGIVVYSAPIQERAIRDLHAQVVADRKGRGAA